MAVFYDTGSGDIYAGLTKADVLAAMREDCDEIEESDMEEVSGNTSMREIDENEAPTGDTTTLAEEYGDDTMAYCICSDNC